MSLGSAASRITMVTLLFLIRIRFQAYNSLVGTLWKRCGQDLVKEVRALEKLDFKYRKALLDLNFLTSCRNNNVIPKFLHFKVSNKQLRSSAAYITCQTYLLNQEILKVVSATFLPVCFLCLKESTCETGKNVFYFTLKAFFVFEIIKF